MHVRSLYVRRNKTKKKKREKETKETTNKKMRKKARNMYTHPTREDIYIFIFLARTNPRGLHLFNKYISGRPLSRIFKFLGLKFLRCSNIEKSLFLPCVHFSADYTAPGTRLQPHGLQPKQNEPPLRNRFLFASHDGDLIRSANLSTLNRPDNSIRCYIAVLLILMHDLFFRSFSRNVNMKANFAKFWYNLFSSILSIFC